MALELTYYPDPILRKRAIPVEKIDSDLRDKVQQMFDIMYREHGVGLAAPQVSWSVRLFVVNLASSAGEGEERIYINPKILAAEGESIEEEGCLSIPEISGKVTRSQKVRVEAQGLDGEWFTEEVEDLHARAIQHELDHLDGILFIQRLSPTDQLLIKKALRKLQKSPPEKRSSSVK